jgi:hypothetical protein
MDQWRVVCRSQHHDPPGWWFSEPMAYDDARRAEVQHGMRFGLTHEDTQVIPVETETPQAPYEPPAPEAPAEKEPGSETQIGLTRQFDFHDKNWSNNLSLSVGFPGVTWPQAKHRFLHLFDEPTLNAQIDLGTGRLQLAAQVDLIKLSLEEICERCHESVLHQVELHLQYQRGLMGPDGHHARSGLEDASVFLSKKFGDWQIQINANIQSADGEVHGQVSGSVVWTLP